MKRVLSSAVIMFLFAGCGGGGSSTATPTNVGYLQDSAVVGAEYTTSSGFSGTTGPNGEFRFNHNDNVTFKVGNIVLGTVKVDVNGTIVTPENFEGTDEQKEALTLQFLQSLDIDHNPNNGIQISQEFREDLKHADPLELNHQYLTESELLTYIDDSKKTKEHIQKDPQHLKVAKEEAIKHFEKTKEEIKKHKQEMEKEKNKAKDELEKAKDKAKDEFEKLKK